MVAAEAGQNIIVNVYFGTSKVAYQREFCHGQVPIRTWKAETRKSVSNVIAWGWDKSTNKRRGELIYTIYTPKTKKQKYTKVKYYQNATTMSTSWFA